MSEKHFVRSNLFKGLLIIGGWSLVALIFTLKHSISAASFGKEFVLENSLTTQFVSCVGWMLLTPFIIWLGKHFLPEGRHTYRNTFLLVLAGISIIILQTAYQAFVFPIVGFPSDKNYTTYFAAFKGMFVSNWLLSFALYVMTLGVALIATYYGKYQSRELLSSRLEANLNRARLQILKMQMHPHFLFNTHNAITELIYKDPATAEKILTNLSDLLRISLEGWEVEEVPLQKELEFIEKYIEIEQIRFQERLQFRMRIAPDTLDAVVPNMILQPLVENAVRHGITPLREGGTIKIISLKKGDKLQIRVSDNGVGFPKDGESILVKGIGLANTKARLLHLYKDEQNFEIDSNEEGFSVKMEFPFVKFTEREKSKIEVFNPKLVHSN